MPHLSPFYRVLTVLYSVFGFGRIFFAVLDDFFFGFAVSKGPNAPLIWVIDQVCSVEMAGYWPSSFFACLWTEEERDQYQAVYGFWGYFSCVTRGIVPSGQDRTILPALVADHSSGFDSSCPLTELAI